LLLLLLLLLLLSAESLDSITAHSFQTITAQMLDSDTH
jgi:hypothetical protein